MSTARALDEVRLKVAEPPQVRPQSRRLWVNLARFEWRGLVLVPVSEQVALGALGAELERVGREELQAELRWADLRGAGLAQVQAQLAELALAPGRWIAGVAPVWRSAAGHHAARAASAVVLAIALGDTRRDELEQTLAVLEGQRVLGSVLVEP
jgi:hypothetical protein